VNQALQIERIGNIAQITMNLPKTRNALASPLYTGLAAELARLQDDTDVRAIVLTGGRHFCVGGDLGGLEVSPLEIRREMAHGHRIIRLLAGGPWPVIAAVEGNAYGAGFSLALACDFVVADEETSFCAAFGRVGLAPDYGLMWSLPQRVGTGMAREILMLCEPLAGARARELGLVDRLVTNGTVLEEALKLAARLALAPPGAMAATKAALARLPMPLDPLLAWEADTQALLVNSEDFAEGVRAFREKRSPRFTGK